MSEVKVNKISPRSGTDVTLGDSSDTFTVPSGVGLTLTNSTLLLPTTIQTDKLDPKSGTALEIGTSGDTITVPTGAGLTVTDEVKTNKISPATGVAFALGDSGDTFTVPSGATITNNGTATGFGGGLLLQSISAVIASASGTSTIPFDDTTPLVGEGTEIFSQDLTPANTSNKVRIHGVIQAGALGQDSSNGFGVAIFRDSTCVGIYAFQDWTAYTEGSYCFPIDIIDAPSSTSAIDYSLRVGNLYDAAHNTTTWYVGRTGRGSKFNGASALNTVELNEIDGT